MNSSLVFQFFFPVLLALGVFEFFVFTKAKNFIDYFAAIFFIVAAIASLFAPFVLAHLEHSVSLVAVVALVLAAYVAAAPVGVTLGEGVRDRFAGVFYVLVLVAVAAVYLPFLVFIV